LSWPGYPGAAVSGKAVSGKAVIGNGAFIIGKRETEPGGSPIATDNHTFRGGSAAFRVGFCRVHCQQPSHRRRGHRMPEQDADTRSTPAEPRNAAPRDAAARGAAKHPKDTATQHPGAPDHAVMDLMDIVDLTDMELTDRAEVVARFAGPEYRRLLDAARRSLEQTGGDLSRMVTVKSPDDKERRAIIEITGQYRPEGVGVLAVRLADVDLAVRAATGHGLIRLLERIGPPLKDRPAERLRLSDGREAAIRSAEKSFLSSRGWYQAWLAELAADGTLSRLVNSDDVGQLRQAARVLEWVEQRIELRAAPAQLGKLSATITGDTKALGHGTPLGTLVLRALAFRLGAERPRTTEERRDLWDRNGIIVDDLASRVLVLNLSAGGSPLGEWLASAKTHGTPFYVTLHQLVTLPPDVAPGQLVHACENPVVLRRAAAELGPAAPPLVCTEGQPSTAFHRLAKAITGAHGELSYHGDFDWPGIGIATGIMGRHGARPWRLGAADYEAAIKQGAGSVTLAGTRQPTPWDAALGETMAAHGQAVYEESVVGRLIGDLSGTPGERTP
jgi:uncharacterized protein (TIGR02679 family)